MRYFLINRFGPNPMNSSDAEYKTFLDSLRKDAQDYRAYLESVKTRLSKAVYEFAVADWHYDPTNPKCPHDAWIQEIKIREFGQGEAYELRKAQIEIVLLGAYHDRLLKLTYLEVSSYSMTPSEYGTRGDWITDEISLSESGRVVHEIQFADESILRFECQDIVFEEQLTSTPDTAVWAD